MHLHKQSIEYEQCRYESVRACACAVFNAPPTNAVPCAKKYLIKRGGESKKKNIFEILASKISLNLVENKRMY